MIKLTRVDGSSVWLGGGFAVQAVNDDLQAWKAAEGSRSHVIYEGVTHYVTEDPEEVVARIESGERR